MKKWKDWRDPVRTVVSGFRSVSNWEDSYFGGYQNVLWDHPEIKIDHGLEWKNESSKDMGYYIFDKLVKLFFLECKKQGMLNTLTNNLTQEKVIKWFQPCTRYHVSPRDIQILVEHLKTSNLELSNMFGYYEDILVNTRMWYDEPDPPKGGGGKGKGKSEEEGESKGNSDGKGEDNPDKGEGDAQSQGAGGQDQDQDGKGDRDGKGGNSGENAESEEEPDWKNGSPVTQAGKKPNVVRIMQNLLDSVKEKSNVSHYVNWISNSNGAVSFNNMRPSSYDHPYSDQEKADAIKLINMLDISFDPAHDKVGSLKSGKMETHKLAEVMSGNFNIYHRMEENISTKPFAICVLCDQSGSMSGTHIRYAAGMMRVLYLAFSQILPPNKMFFYGHTNMIVDVYHDPYNQNFDRTIAQMHADGGNYDGPAIEAVYNKVRTFTDDNIIFVSVSDGQPNAWKSENPISQIKRIVEKLKRDGFATAGVGVGYDMVKDIYPYHTVISDPRDFVKKVSLLINHVVKMEFQN